MLQSIVGKGDLSTSQAVREQHGRDESYHKTRPPDAVVFPRSLEQVQEIAKCVSCVYLYYYQDVYSYVYCMRRNICTTKHSCFLDGVIILKEAVSMT